MKTRLALTCIATLFSLALSESHAADWMESATKACAVAREAPEACEKARELVRAAAAVAAYVVLEKLYPEQQEVFESLLAIELANVPETQAKADALARGRQAGLRLLP